jgi:hypothetical protein
MPGIHIALAFDVDGPAQLAMEVISDGVECGH